MRVYVDVRFGDSAAAELLDEVKGTLHAVLRRVAVHALFKARAGVRLLPECAGRLADGIPCESSRLEENFLGGFLDFAVLAAHNAREGDGAISIANDEVVLVQSELFIVQGDDALPLLGAANDDFGILQIRKVEGVHGLSHFEKDEVGNIDDVGNGAKPLKGEPLSHPGGRTTYFDVGNIVSDVARAEIGRFDKDAHIRLRLVLGIGEIGEL